MFSVLLETPEIKRAAAYTRNIQLLTVLECQVQKKERKRMGRILKRRNLEHWRKSKEQKESQYKTRYRNTTKNKQKLVFFFNKKRP